MVCPCVVPFHFAVFVRKNTKTLRSTTHRVAQRPRPSAFLCATPLLDSQAAREKLGQCPQPVRSSLIAAIAQPFSSRLFFLSASNENPDRNKTRTGTKIPTGNENKSLKKTSLPRDGSSSPFLRLRALGYSFLSKNARTLSGQNARSGKGIHS